MLLICMIIFTLYVGVCIGNATTKQVECYHDDEEIDDIPDLDYYRRLNEARQAKVAVKNLNIVPKTNNEITEALVKLYTRE